jgi:polar amino acid transport system substrate-binding protein
MKRKSLVLISVVLLASVLLTACGSGSTAKVTVALDATWPPFESVNESTKALEGFDVALMDAIAKNQGFEVSYQNIPFDSVITGMAQCQYDAAISAVTITEERSKNMSFSTPYFAAGQIVTVAKDNTSIAGKDSLSGKKVGAMIGTTGAIEAQKIQGVDYRAYDTIDLAFLDVISGQLDAVVADNPLSLGYVGKYPDKLKTVGDVFTDENYGIAVCKTKTDLLAKMNAGLEAVKKDGTFDKLVDQWVVKGGAE